MSCSPSTRRARASPTPSARPRPERGRPRPDRRPPVLRRHRGRDRLPALHALAPLRAGAELQHRHQPRRQAGARVTAGPRRRLQPVLAAAGPARASGSPATPTGRPASPTSPSGIRGSRPSSPGTTSAAPARRRRGARQRLAATDRRAAVPGRPRRSHHRPDHQAGARHLRRLRAAADAEHLAAGPAGKSTRVAGLLQGRRRLRRDRHPRRLAPGLQLHPQPGVRRLAARARHHRLVH